ncbi:MAG: hypothetical protein P8X57_03345 [Cyclobacteriaceae bacterium]
MKQLTIIFLVILAAGCQNDKQQSPEASAPAEPDSSAIIYPGEKHLANVRQLTFGGDNAEAYWSFDGNRIVFQSNYDAWDVNCDQIFYTDAESTLKDQKPPMISTGMGRTTCAYFMPGDTTVVYASTHLGGEDCPVEPERDAGRYVWPVYDSYDIFVTDLNGNIIRQLTNEPGYDAEATVSPKGDRIVFTSDRTGDLELFTMNLDGSDVRQVTDELGYDGGAFFSPDGSKLIFRASRPDSEEEINEYKSLLKEGLVKPTEMELFICNTDGSDLRQLTNLGKANWAPFFHPSGEKIIFSSNHAGERGFEFNLYMIDIDGSNLERITYDDVFDSFPMFSPDGTQLIFSSNRNNNGTRDTNLFIADWVE